MIIHVSTAGARLDAPEDLKAFKVLVAEGLHGEALAAALGPAGRLDGDHAWISPDWLRAASGRAGDAAWVQGFEAMLAYAAKKGWVDAAGAIRGHIERG
ncbi:hypothetical protein [Paracraurococcus lichenis]|uniref:DUF3775 domain-containing protein n=1 Tax=Paracraurococcus lichenis TaxID=3064888 RepID=A0ABT9DTF9_9PROT|nr:hypothetical protein [Paracraurococcus sp. LOR1-02]MDO9707173.1 hypothetical protein [Paracraurococcus sp. LOR1-02]